MAPLQGKINIVKEDDRIKQSHDYCSATADLSSSSSIDSRLQQTKKVEGEERTDDLTEEERSNYVSLDCEMVGVGEHGQRSMLARVCIVDWNGMTMYDTYVKPTEPVTDYRTFVSGITQEYLNSPDTTSFRKCRKEVLQILKGKVLVGHALENDLQALRIDTSPRSHHPHFDMRDTATYKPFMQICKRRNFDSSSSSNYQNNNTDDSATSCNSSSCDDSTCNSTPSSSLCWSPRKLKDLAKEKLNRDIQTYGVAHSPLEDAKTALDLYKLVRFKWEEQIKRDEVIRKQQESKQRQNMRLLKQKQIQNMILLQQQQKHQQQQHAAAAALAASHYYYHQQPSSPQPHQHTPPPSYGYYQQHQMYNFHHGQQQQYYQNNFHNKRRSRRNQVHC